MGGDECGFNQSMYFSEGIDHTSVVVNLRRFGASAGINFVNAINDPGVEIVKKERQRDGGKGVFHSVVDRLYR